MDRSKKIKIFCGLILIIFFAAVGMTGAMKSKTFEIKNTADNPPVLTNADTNPPETIQPQGDKSPINGLVCANPKQRPIAVMLGGDPESRPLSGLSEADLVVEMPVVTSSITRYMAIFACNKTAEIGNIRSARHDYIPLAMGFDAILAHWGGSHFALDKLNAGIMDNINALYLDGTVFYRKLGKVAPFNGFTSFDRLENYATQRNYHLTDNFEGYKFLDKEDPAPTSGRLTIGYPSAFKVEYQYDPEKNEYLRFKGGSREMDKNNSQQVAAKDVVIMYVASRQIEGQYNDVDVEGEGKAIVYENGKEITGKWSKDKSKPASKLFFYDDAGQEIAFVPGQIWIQIVQPDQSVDWTAGIQ
jgi:hypothetical protein